MSLRIFLVAWKASKIFWEYRTASVEVLWCPRGIKLSIKLNR